MQYYKWNEVKKIIDQIPHYQTVFTKEEANLLYQLSLKTAGKGEIVEIGTNMGVSAIALASGQKQKDGHPITSIDIWEHPDVEKNLNIAGISDYVERIIGESSKIASGWSRDIEFLLLDGDHSYTGTASDIINWSKFVIVDGIIVFHDYPGDHNSREVWKAVSRYLLSKPEEWRVLSDREVSRIFVLKRIAFQKEKMFILSRLSSWLYWRYRDMRHFVFKHFPKASSQIVQRLKDR